MANLPLINIGEVVTHMYYNKYQHTVFPGFGVLYVLLPTTSAVTTNPVRYTGENPQADLTQRYEVVSVNDPRIVGSQLGEKPIISTFGEMTVGSRVPFINAQFVLGLNPNEFVSGGNPYPLVTIVGNIGFENMMEISTGPNAGENVGYAETKSGLRYIPGYEFGAWFTVVYTPPTVDGYIKTGLFDGDNGFWVGFKLHGGSIKFGICRVKDGVEYFTPQEDFNIDKLDGTGLSKYVLDTSKGNVYFIRGGYLGFAPVIFGLKLPNGQILHYHIIEYPNTQELTHISNTNLPARTDVSNGTADEIVKIVTGSLMAYVTDGANIAANTRQFSKAATGTLIAGAYNGRILIAFRNEGIYSGGFLPSPKTHRIETILDFLALTLDGQNKSVLLEVIVIDKSYLVSGNWVSADPASILEYSQDAVYTDIRNNGKVVFATSFRSNVSDKIELFLSDLKLSIRPGEHGVFALTSSTTSAIEYVFSNVWSELW